MSKLQLPRLFDSEYFNVNVRSVIFRTIKILVLARFLGSCLYI